MILRALFSLIGIGARKTETLEERMDKMRKRDDYEAMSQAFNLDDFVDEAAGADA